MKNIVDYINLESFEIEREYINVPYSFDDDEITHHKTHLFPEFHIFEKYVKVDLQLTILTFKEGVQLDAKITMDIYFIYEVENIDELTKVFGNETILETSLLILLIETSYSTLRGILMMRLQPTIFKNFVLPMIDTTDFLKLIEQIDKNKEKI